MQFFGYCGQARHGEICHLIMATGKIPTAAFVVGVIVVCGKICLKSSLPILTMNG
jgi:hypothetical protein